MLQKHLLDNNTPKSWPQKTPVPSTSRIDHFEHNIEASEQIPSFQYGILPSVHQNILLRV
jgi:hypothetical protein